MDHLEETCDHYGDFARTMLLLVDASDRVPLTKSESDRLLSAVEHACPGRE